MSGFTKGGRKRTAGASVAVSGPEVDEDGSAFVTGALRYMRAIPAAGTDIPNWPCAALLLSADATVTVQAAEDDTAIALVLKAGIFHPIAARKVTVISTGTVTGCWIRKPDVA